MTPLPLLNITMPVFNRFDLTQLAIISLRKSNGAIPFTLTVVDNGSEKRLVDRLVEFKNAGLIDKLFLLPENMGISCACNIGWEMTDAPYYMKLDNDMVAQRPDWLERLFALWRYGYPLSNLGAAWSGEQLLRNEGWLSTPHGVLGACRVNLGGGAILIPKGVSDALGFWNEELTRYGAEDGDYGLRMNGAGFPQYYYLAEGLLRHMDPGLTQARYAEHGLDRTVEYNAVVRDAKGGVGIYILNYYLYSAKIRTLKPPRKYAVAEVDGLGRVTLKERKEYMAFHKALMYCKREVDAELAKGDANSIMRPEFIERLKTVMRNCGQEYAPVATPVPRRRHSPVDRDARP